MAATTHPYVMQAGAAAAAMERARKARETWVVCRPGCIALYEAPNRAAAEAMLTNSLRKSGYHVRPADRAAE